MARLGGGGGKRQRARCKEEGKGRCVPDRPLSSMGNGRKKQKRRILRQKDRAGQEIALEMCVVCHLLAHCALVGVSGGLVVVGVGY